MSSQSTRGKTKATQYKSHLRPKEIPIEQQIKPTEGFGGFGGSLRSLLEEIRSLGEEIQRALGKVQKLDDGVTRGEMSKKDEEEGLPQPV